MKLLVFSASFVPFTALLYGILGSEWLFDRYGFFGAWVLLPAFLVVAALIQSVVYYRYIFISTGVLFRAGASLALGIFAVLLSFGICIVLHGIFPHHHDGQYI